MPGQAGAPGKEGLIGPKVRGLPVVDSRGIRMGKEGHDRAIRVSGEGNYGAGSGAGLEISG